MSISMHSLMNKIKHVSHVKKGVPLLDTNIRL